MATTIPRIEKKIKGANADITYKYPPKSGPTNVPNRKFDSNQEKWIFVEDQSRYILIIEEKFDIKKFVNKGIDIKRIGIVKGTNLEFTNCFEIPVKNLIKLNNKWFNDYLK